MRQGCSPPRAEGQTRLLRGFHNLQQQIGVNQKTERTKQGWRRQNVVYSSILDIYADDPWKECVVH